MTHRKPLALGAFALAFLFALGLLLLPIALSPPAARAEPTPSAGADMRVIDGDTIEDMAADITYRIVNIDTPETGPRARCSAERELGDRATSEVRALVAGSEQMELRPTGRIDRYGRTIAFVVIDGRDLGETLIALGLARPWRGRREPWCDSSGNLLP